MKEVATRTFWIAWDGFFYGVFFLTGITALAKFAMWVGCVNFPS